MMKIHYRELKDGTLELLRCFGKEDILILPNEIEGKSITRIGDYAFSPFKKKEEEAKVFQEEKGILEEDCVDLLCGDKIREIYLPAKTIEIGKYAFYGCANMEVLGFSEALQRTGTGIFTGCKLKKIVLHLHQGKKSALRDIVQDTRYLLEAEIRFMELGKEAHLVFPEYYEEAVENTPARIIENHFHGTGYPYRQCFFRGEIDYRKYDDLFPVAAVQEAPRIVWKILTARMLYPMNMTEYAWMQYEGYVKEHQAEMMEYLGERERMPFLQLCSKENFFTEAGIRSSIAWASAEEEMEILSFLMNEQHQKFPQKRKTFEL